MGLGRRTFVLVLSAALAGPIAAEGVKASDPRLLSVSGEASEIVPVDGVRISFGFSTEKGSFQDSGAAGEEEARKLRDAVASINGVKVKAVHGWDLLRQAKISIGDRGRRIDHHVALEIEGIAEGKLHTVVAQAIDRSLPVAKDVTVESVQAYLTKDRERELRAKLKAQAVKRAGEKARALAEAAGVKLSAPQQVIGDSVEGGVEPMMARGRMALFSSMEWRKGFNVSTEVPDSMEVTESVGVLFQIQ
jgi:uncharacterized protein YggE